MAVLLENRNIVLFGIAVSTFCYIELLSLRENPRKVNTVKRYLVYILYLIIGSNVMTISSRDLYNVNYSTIF